MSSQTPCCLYQCKYALARNFYFAHVKTYPIGYVIAVVLQIVVKDCTIDEEVVSLSIRHSSIVIQGTGLNRERSFFAMTCAPIFCFDVR